MRAAQQVARHTAEHGARDVAVPMRACRDEVCPDATRTLEQNVCGATADDGSLQ